METLDDLKKKGYQDVGNNTLLDPNGVKKDYIEGDTRRVLVKDQGRNDVYKPSDSENC